jgi:hypothetical protein
MGTRAHIGMENLDGTVTAIYCHYDGYTSHTGKNLLLYYKTARRVAELMKIGAINQLKGKPKDCEKLGEPAMSFRSVLHFSYNKDESGVEHHRHYAYLFRAGKWEWKHLDEGAFDDLSLSEDAKPEPLERFAVCLEVFYDPRKTNPSDIPELVRQGVEVPGLMVGLARRAK